MITLPILFCICSLHLSEQIQALIELGAGKGINDNFRLFVYTLGIMKKKSSVKTYTLDEVKTHMDKYVDDSATRLRNRLKLAWKKQAQLKVGWYNEVVI